MTQSVISILAWLGGACFCGFLPLCFATLLFFTSRRRGQIGSAVSAAKKTTIVALHPGSSLLRLQGQITPMENAIDGATENALVFLRLKVEAYETDSDSSGWKGLTDKTRGIPFQLNDGTGSVWINPEGLDKQLLGDGITPDDNQVQAACILLGISPKILSGRLRFRLWELRAGQTVNVIGGVTQGQYGLVISRIQGQPYIVSPLIGQAVETKITTQSKTAQVWTLVLGIPGLLFLLCGLSGALVSLIRVVMNK